MKDIGERERLDIFVGAIAYQDRVRLHRLSWGTNNGILISGQSGSGKSTTATSLLYQYAYDGAKIVICDYGASFNTGQTLTERCEALEGSFYLPPVTTGADIEARINRIKQIGVLRKEGKQEHFPLIVAIDEFAALAMSHKPTKKARAKKVTDSEGYTITERQAEPTYFETLLDSILTLRKYNVRFMLIAQEWAQLGTSGVRALRSNLSVQLHHRLDKSSAGLFGLDSEETAMVMKLAPGRFLYKGVEHAAITGLRTQNALDAIRTKIKSYPTYDAPEKTIEKLYRNEMYL